MKVIFDTNVLISAVLTEGLCWKILTRANRKEFELFVSPYILKEFEDTLSQKFNFPLNSVQEALYLIKEVSTLVNPEEKGVIVKDVCRDPKDDPILACAVVSKADYLVTGDPDLLVLDSYKEAKIVRPRVFDELFTVKK